jgi:hypothetical protein
LLSVLGFEALAGIQVDIQVGVRVDILFGILGKKGGNYWSQDYRL